MSLKILVFNPGGNTTALVTERVNKRYYVKVAKAVMKKFPDIEQVGFVIKDEKGSFVLNMMGGEFCLNAARCAALWWFKEHKHKICHFRVSGFPGLVTAVLRGKNIQVTLPQHFFVKQTQQPEGLRVDLKGISFLVLKQSEFSEKLLQKYKTGVPAFGIIGCSFKNRDLKISSAVWVNKTKSLVYETGCGSGSLAAAVANKGLTKDFSQKIIQPNGSSYLVKYAKKKKLFYISGRVNFIGQRTIKNSN